MQHQGSAEAYAANFGTALRRMRLERRLSQRQVAEYAASAGLRLDPTAVTRIERGERDVRLGEAVVLARVLGGDVQQMAKGAGDALLSDLFNEFMTAWERAARAAVGASEAGKALDDHMRSLEGARELLPALVDEWGKRQDASPDQVAWVKKSLLAVGAAAHADSHLKSEERHRDLMARVGRYQSDHGQPGETA